MTNKSLSQVVAEVLTLLQQSRVDWDQRRPKHSIFENWNNCAAAKVNLDVSLRNTKDVLDRRDRHMKSVGEFLERQDKDLAILHLKAFQIDAWSAYDRLYDVYSRIVGNSATTLNSVPKSNVKLEEFFKGKGEKLRLGSINGNDALLLDNFRWSYLVSYKVRNVIVHDGGYLKEKTLFEYDSAQNILILSPSVDKMFTPEPKEVDVDGAKASSSRSNDAGFPWFGFNAVEVLRSYNEDLDSVLGVLLHQAVVGFAEQVKYLCSLSA